MAQGDKDVNRFQQATILEQARPLASQRVRWQAVRALGRAELLAGLDPASADPAAFEAW